MHVLRKMMEGAMSGTRTELVVQIEEAGFIPAIFEYLKVGDQQRKPSL
jgi:hypothetical protein